MTKMHHTLVDVRAYLVKNEKTIPNPMNPTEFNLFARTVTLGLNEGKAPKQITERIKGYLTTLYGETTTTVDGSDADGIDDPRTEADLDAAYEVDSNGIDQSDMVEGDEGFDSELQAEAAEPTDTQPDAPGEDAADSDAPAEDGEEAEEIETKGSVVKSQYRQLYKLQGDVRGCGDWLHLILKATTLGAKKKLIWEQFEAICEANNVDAAQYATEAKRTNGWQGRARMSGRKLLEFTVARENTLLIPLGIVTAHQEKVDALVNSAVGADFVYEIEDDMAAFRPTKAFTDKIMSSRKNKGEKEAL